MSTEIHVKIAVIGGGPGGYTAAFRAADCLQKEHAVCLIEKTHHLGGVCLHVGCIPSKSLLHLASHKKHLAILKEAGLTELTHGDWDLPALQAYQHKPIQQLAQGLSALAKKRKILHLQGEARLESAKSLSILDDKGVVSHTIYFEELIIAIGSIPTLLPFLPTDVKIVDSTGALMLQSIPERLLIIGAGIIGFEMSQVYTALGSQVTIVEAASEPLAQIDPDLVKPLIQMMNKDGITLWTQTAVQSVKVSSQVCSVTVKTEDGKTQTHDFEMILQCVGRKPCNQNLNLEAVGIALDSKGFIPVDLQTLETTVPKIFAIGDCIGDPMLAHKSVAQGKVAAMRACGHDEIFDPRCIPSVVYTDPEIAWVGFTEQQLTTQKIPFKKAVFPWLANGRAIVTRNLPGLTKVLIDPESERILGAGILGAHAGDLIGEMTLAIEMGAVLTDIVLTIHPHPTFVETIALACEVAEGSITDLIPTVRSKP